MSAVARRCRRMNCRRRFMLPDGRRLGISHASSVSRLNGCVPRGVLPRVFLSIRDPVSMMVRPFVLVPCIVLLTGASLAQDIKAPAGIGAAPSHHGDAGPPAGGSSQLPSTGPVPAGSPVVKPPVGGAGAASGTSSNAGVGTGVGGPPGTGGLPGTGGTSGGPGGINR